MFKPRNSRFQAGLGSLPFLVLLYMFLLVRFRVEAGSPLQQS
jgi:hypothetical protein